MISKVENFRPTLLGRKVTPVASAKDLGVLALHITIMSLLPCPAALRAWGS